MRSTGLDEAQTGIKIAGRNINNLGYADDTTLKAESKEELKSLLIVPLTTRRSNQSILKEISPEYSLEGLMLKLKVQYLAYLM